MPLLNPLDQSLNKIPLAAHFLILFFVAILGGICLVPGMLWIHNSDLMIFPLAADHMLRGEWGAFPFEFGYGGTFLTTLRALWVGGVSFFWNTRESHVWAHGVFSYIAFPYLISLSMFFAVQSYFSRAAAVLVSIMSAVGFVSWAHMAGTDFYLSFIFLAGILISLRSNFNNPLIQMSPRLLLVTGWLIALSVSTWRASLIYAVAILMPWQDLKKYAQKYFKESIGIHRFVKIIVVTLIVLYFLAEFLAGEFGVLFGKRIKIHSLDLLTLAGYLFALQCLLIFEFHKNKKLITNLRPFVLGCLIGFSPELIYFLAKGVRPPHFGSTDLPQMIKIWSQIPRAARELLLGWGHLRKSNSFVHIFPVILFLVSLPAFIFHGLRSDKLRWLAALAVLCCVAFGRVYMTEFGASRYLLPLFPVFLVSVAWLYDSTKKQFWSWGVLTLIFLTLCSQMAEKFALATWIKNEKKIEEILEVVRIFESRGLKTIYTDNYWQSTQYTFASREDLSFVPIEDPIVPPALKILGTSEKHVGIFLTKPIEKTLEGKSKPERNVFFGRRFKLSPLAQMGDLRLYVGDAE